MVRWLSRIRMAFLGLALACPAPAMAADPFVMFLLRMLRDQAISASIEAGVGASPRPSAPGGAAVAPGFGFEAPPPTSESQQLKMLIDDSFVHLGARQREELHASLMQILNDPKNAASRGIILSEFNGQALALRNSHRMLSQLSESDMRIVAASARAEYARLPVEQRQQLLRALQHGVPGMPRALHEMMLAEFNSVTR